MNSRFVGQADRRRIQDLLLDYVGIHSVNPALDGGPGEVMLVARVEEELQRLGLETHRQRVGSGGRDNIIARLSGAADSPVVMFEAHLDTVGLSGKATTNARSFQGLVYGRGACDTKGSLVAMLETMRLLVGTDPADRATVVFVGSVDEEVAGAGARALVAEDHDYDMAVVGEPTGLEMATAHKGVLRFQIATLGKPAHSSRPHLGVNAILAMTPVLDALANVYAPQLMEVVHPLVGSPTINVSTIRGGTAENVVPAECVISIDRRLNPGESHEKVLDDIDALLDLVRESGVEVERRAPSLATAPLDTPADHPLVTAIGLGREAILGYRGRPCGVSFGTDGSFFGPGGVPCVVFGPGSIDQAHSDEEWVGIEETAQAAEILAEAMMALA